MFLTEFVQVMNMKYEITSNILQTAITNLIIDLLIAFTVLPLFFNLLVLSTVLFVVRWPWVFRKAPSDKHSY